MKTIQEIQKRLVQTRNRMENLNKQLKNRDIDQYTYTHNMDLLEERELVLECVLDEKEV